MTKSGPFTRILIANRGEIALRVIRTCRERGIETVAVYSDADRFMPHVRTADRSVYIGPPPPRESYLRMDAIIAAARETGADAIHPGYGFLSENPAFAEAVEAAGLAFIGPSAESIRAMGEKTRARALVSAAGVPTVPGTDGPARSLREVERFCARTGFPVLLKAAAGGGGKGMRVVKDRSELAEAFRTARSEALSAFGDDSVYAEKYLEAPRHVEIQVLGDRFGAVVHLGERECSVQRRHQKVVEESPSPAVDEQLRAAMGATAVEVARACGYCNAGTVEFLLDQDGRYYFLEMNTRLQVEHPITELRTGLDIVGEQIRIAGGEPLGYTQEDVRFHGHAIECRICAEDPSEAYIPSTGTIVHLRAPGGPGIRDDRGYDEGSEVSVYYDSLLSKLVVWASGRQEAIARMRRALREYVILGVKTNIPLCNAVLDSTPFRTGDYSTRLLDRDVDPRQTASADTDSLHVAIALAAYLEDARRNFNPAKELSPSTSSSLRGWKASRWDFNADRHA
jgi:acetyl-CoA carboxylase biotin carboxylase subunit